MTTDTRGIALTTSGGIPGSGRFAEQVAEAERKGAKRECAPSGSMQH